jgi:hypothetical protein
MFSRLANRRLQAVPRTSAPRILQFFERHAISNIHTLRRPTSISQTRVPALKNAPGQRRTMFSTADVRRHKVIFTIFGAL